MDWSNLAWGAITYWETDFQPHENDGGVEEILSAATRPTRHALMFCYGTLMLVAHTLSLSISLQCLKAPAPCVLSSRSSSFPWFWLGSGNYKWYLVSWHFLAVKSTSYCIIDTDAHGSALPVRWNLVYLCPGNCLMSFGTQTWPVRVHVHGVHMQEAGQWWSRCLSCRTQMRSLFFWFVTVLWILVQGREM